MSTSDPATVEAYLKRVAAAAYPDPSTDARLSVLDALSAIAQVLTHYGVSADADLDTILDLVEEAYARQAVTSGSLMISTICGEA